MVLLWLLLVVDVADLDHYSSFDEPHDAGF
jgi:hypothetical protein